MSTTAYGILYWGFPLTEEEAEVVENAMKREVNSDYFKPWKEGTKCEVFTCGHYDIQMWAIAIHESIIDAEWSESIEVSLGINSEWGAQLKDFCDTVKLPYREPKWYLTSRYD